MCGIKYSSEFDPLISLSKIFLRKLFRIPSIALLEESFSKNEFLNRVTKHQTRENGINENTP